MNNPHERKGFTFYRSFLNAIRKLSDADKVVVYEAIADYSLDGIEPNKEEFSPFVQILWEVILPNLEADRRRYSNGSKGGCPKGTEKPSMIGNQNAKKQNKTETKPNQNQIKTETNPKQNQNKSNVNVNVNANVNANVNVDVEENGGEESPVAQNAQHFEPPTIVEIENYIHKQGYTDIDAHSFADYYASVGWRVGSQPMHDWKAALRRWHTRNKQTNNHLKHPKNEPKQTSTNPTNAPRLFRNLADEEYLADAHPRLGTLATHIPRDCRKATH